jgi:hypothetical protein
MTWGQEILRALFLTLGATEIITNLVYITRENGLELARKQHGELPVNISDNKIMIKVICMLFSGLALFGSSLLCYILHKYLHNIILMTSILFSLYGIAEALYYRYWKTTGFAFVTILILVFSILI